jgi:hypothetical protein
MELSIPMSMDSEETVVQTELESDEYDRLKRVAEDEGISLKEALKRAALAYTSAHGRHDPEDPFFAGEPEPCDDTDEDEDLTARKTETYLYGGE